MSKTETLLRTPEMAIHGLEYAKTITSYSGILKSIDVAKIAIERLMIAKKPVNDYAGSIFVVAVCPTCGETLEEIKLLDYGNHCPNCGQKIDWSK